MDKNAINSEASKMLNAVKEYNISNIYFLNKSYINGSENYGRTIRFGSSSLGGYKDDTYWICFDLNGNFAVGVQVNGATNPVWYMK